MKRVAMVPALVAGVCTIAATAAKADISVGQLYENCRPGADHTSEAICLGYFTGFDMGFTLGLTAMSRKAGIPVSKVWCHPVGATFDSYIAVFRALALRNRDHWNDTRAGIGLMGALVEAWPCQRQ